MWMPHAKKYYVIKEMLDIFALYQSKFLLVLLLDISELRKIIYKKHFHYLWSAVDIIIFC